MFFRTILPCLVLSFPMACSDTKGESVDDCVSVDDVGDGLDQNCDGIDGVDEDGDGFASLQSGGLDCDDQNPSLTPADIDEDGFSTCDADCDDSETAAYPGAAQNDSVLDCMLDRDGDGYGEANPDSDVIMQGTDCDDADPELSPEDADEDGQSSCAGDCDDADSNAFMGAAYNEGAEYCTRDTDGDGWGDPDFSGGTLTGTDCDDNDPSLNRDDVDGDGQSSCDGDCDDADSFTFTGVAYLDDPLSCMHDGDQDGWGDSTASLPIVPGLDCADGDSSIHPNATEVCDDIDNNCNGYTDLDDIDLDYDTANSQYIDVDGDGYGDPNVHAWHCGPELGWADNALDCQDNDLSIHPDAIEVCDSVDNDCDLMIDDLDPDLDMSTSSLWYADNDSDGFGSGLAEQLCDAPMGYVANSSDCDDGNDLVHPNATEVCDGIDNDCDTALDDADSSLDMLTAMSFWLDADSDSYGSGSPTLACLAPVGHVANEDDCNDQNSAIHPQAQEVCDGIDNDCDTWIDDADSSVDLSQAPLFYPDSDADGQGGLPGQPACMLLPNHVSNQLDCDDTDPFTYTGAATQDDPTACMTDGDLDGYGDANAMAPIVAGSDCGDSDASQNILATDNVGDGLDNNCDGVDGVDSDGDGFASVGSGGLDCDDQLIDVNPFALEIVNDGIDQDCDGVDASDALGPVADFSLEDLNIHSPRYGQVVSPRDYLQQVSGWYFIKAT